MIKSRYTDLELYNLWANGTHIDDLCEMANIEDRKTLYKRFDRLRNRRQNSTKSTEIVENNSGSQATCLVDVDKVDNSVEKVDNKKVENTEETTDNATDTVETKKANPISLLIAGLIVLLILVGKWVYDWYKRWKSRRNSNSDM